jgi:hypothetical protein
MYLLAENHDCDCEGAAAALRISSGCAAFGSRAEAGFEASFESATGTAVGTAATEADLAMAVASAGFTDAIG